MLHDFYKCIIIMIVVSFCNEHPAGIWNLLKIIEHVSENTCHVAKFASRSQLKVVQNAWQESMRQVEHLHLHLHLRLHLLNPISWICEHVNKMNSNGWLATMMEWNNYHRFASCTITTVVSEREREIDEIHYYSNWISCKMWLNF